ncbi:MAG: sulfite exporter TauE/SafE family protein [Clostridia bacterium]|nr:sulfite exporter TauE/SafE family protein [Clostridia bacterium]
MKNKLLTYTFGFFIGIINGLLGAGGGMLAVPALKKLSLSTKDAHRNAIAVILPLSILSAVLYLLRGDVALSDSFVFIPSGLVGAGVGTLLLKKISPKWLAVIFGAFMVYTGVRLLLR